VPLAACQPVPNRRPRQKHWLTSSQWHPIINKNKLHEWEIAAERRPEAIEFLKDEDKPTRFDIGK
jgi:hypothetical protein